MTQCILSVELTVADMTDFCTDYEPGGAVLRATLSVTSNVNTAGYTPGDPFEAPLILACKYQGTSLLYPPN